MRAVLHSVETGQLTVRQRAFTLVEMMVVIAIAAILLAIGVPAYNDVVLSSKLSSYANDLVSSATQARSEALKRNTTVQLCASSDGANCGGGGWEQGWILLFTDKGGNKTVILRQGAAASGFKITGTVNAITFQSTGLASTAAAFTVCRATPTVGNQERVVSVKSTGRVTTSKTSNASCS